MSEGPTNRRWFRFSFSLRMLFLILTVPALWLGWEVKFVRQRKAMLGLVLAERNGYVLQSHLIARAREDGRKYNPPTIPFVRRFLGDEAVETIIVSDVAGQAQRAISLFPEAVILQTIRASGKQTVIQWPDRDRGDYLGHVID